MPSPQGSPRRGRPSSAAGTPPRSPSGREPRTGSAETSDGTNASRGASSSRPRVDTRSPATRATLAATPVADLVASPLAPLAFDLKKLASQAPARAKDGAIVALSAQLDAMRARLREAEQAAGSPAPVSSTPPSADIDDAAQTHRPTPPASPQPRGGARPATPPRGAARQKDGRGGGSTSRGVVVAEPGPGSGAPFSGYDRAHGVALLRLESEAREWRERLETAERRERDAREETSRRVASARADARVVRD